MVDPYMCFAVEKTSMGRTQDRILKFDLTRKVVANWAKDELHKEFAFDTITGVTTVSDKPFDVALTIRSNSKRYEFTCRTTSELQRLVRLLQGIVTRSLCCKTNDAIVPSRPLLRARVDKAGSFGRWHRRCVSVIERMLLAPKSWCSSRWAQYSVDPTLFFSEFLYRLQAYFARSSQFIDFSR
jgi:hypothetical protein